MFNSGFAVTCRHRENCLLLYFISGSDSFPFAILNFIVDQNEGILVILRNFQFFSVHAIAYWYQIVKLFEKTFNSSSLTHYFSCEICPVSMYLGSRMTVTSSTSPWKRKRNITPVMLLDVLEALNCFLPIVLLSYVLRAAWLRAVVTICETCICLQIVDRTTLSLFFKKFK